MAEPGIYFVDECEEEAFKYCSDLSDIEMLERGYMSRKDCLEHVASLCELEELEIEFEEEE